MLIESHIIGTSYKATRIFCHSCIMFVIPIAKRILCLTAEDVLLEIFFVAVKGYSRYPIIGASCDGGAPGGQLCSSWRSVPGGQLCSYWRLVATVAPMVGSCVTLDGQLRRWHSWWQQCNSLAIFDHLLRLQESFRTALRYCVSEIIF